MPSITKPMTNKPNCIKISITFSSILLQQKKRDYAAK
ncbi:hypothetical protein EVA_15295 [gut metagenome]|uniref:Uncharacterized protein n=1 Tax=gut metagenome TaxID=749906 RepID=J9FQ53_9ZZZZ